MSNIPFRALMEVYKRGVGAWKSSGGVGIRNKITGKKDYAKSRVGDMSKEQWAMARVNAFIEKRPTVFYGSDNDIRERFRLS